MGVFTNIEIHRHKQLLEGQINICSLQVLNPQHAAKHYNNRGIQLKITKNAYPHKSLPCHPESPSSFPSMVGAQAESNLLQTDTNVNDRCLSQFYSFCQCFSSRLLYKRAVLQHESIRSSIVLVAEAFLVFLK